MHLPHTQGAFARRVAMPTRMLHPLPAGIDLRTAALAEPAAVAWHALQRAGDVRGRRVVVIGAGPIGQLVAAVAQRGGAASVTVTDLQQRPREIAEARGIRSLDARAEAEIAELHADVCGRVQRHRARSLGRGLGGDPWRNRRAARPATRGRRSGTPGHGDHP